MSNTHLAALESTIVPENWSGEMELRSGLDGNVSNTGVERYNDLNGVHLQHVETGNVDEDSIYLTVQTNQSLIRMTQAARTRLFMDGKRLVLPANTQTERGSIVQSFKLTCKKQKSVRIEKLVAIYTSRDHAISEASLESRHEINRIGNFNQIISAHIKAWARIWRLSDIEITGNNETQLLLRLHIFHLIQTVSLNTIETDVGIPSRGWHGEAYRGHIFWDELFIFPFINFHFPALARSLIMYRYRRLHEARYAAKEEGYKGAMYPWQSGSNGREESQVIHLNPNSGKWDPDNTYLQRHVNAAIAYNIYQYYKITNDIEFMSYYGTEMMLDIARFWVSKCTYNSDRDKYEIRHVVGPDEFHTRYPDSEEPGLNNNAYTNIMAAWVIKKTLDILELLTEKRKSELMDHLGIEKNDLIHWEDISRKMFIPFHDGDIISQFEGYENLLELDWEKYRKQYDNIQRLDRILKAEGDDPNRYKLSKQADVLMLFFLFSSEELKNIFQRLGYAFDPDMIPRNIDYYKNRSSHGSSLSRLIYSWVLARLDRAESWQYFEEAIKSDFEDIQGGTTPEGIHLGAMAGTVDMLQRCYTGIEVRDTILWMNPVLPREVKSIKMHIRYNGHWIRLFFSSRMLTIAFEEGHLPKVTLGFKTHIFKMGPGEKKEISF
jgi:trehalose/maltose hydrolase-like predicted phosphorylase